jgi:hypothetical protein
MLLVGHAARAEVGPDASVGAAARSVAWAA